MKRVNTMGKKNEKNEYKKALYWVALRVWRLRLALCLVRLPFFGRMTRFRVQSL
jgi:hypothetical protein